MSLEFRLEWLTIHLELKLELEPELEQHPGLELVAVVADWLSLAIAEAILEFENDVLD